MTIVSEANNNLKEEETSFANLYEGTLAGSRRDFETGMIIKARVVHINSEFVLVDIGYKSEGRIPAKEFLDESGNIGVTVGDEIEVMVEMTDDDSGHFILSKTKLDEMRQWEIIDDSCKTGRHIEGKIINRVKGGFQVNLKGITAFLPGSQVDVVPVKDHDKIVGKMFDFKVLKFDRNKQNVIVSHRAVALELREKQRAETLNKIQEGAIVEGVVKGVADYGAFVDLGGVDGLLHVSDISWARVTHPSERLKVGDKIFVKVLKYNKEEGKVSLGLKQTKPEPWEMAGDKYKIGSKVRGKVINIVDYGAFVELEEGVEGLLHISEIGWLKVKHPSERIKNGDEVLVMVLDVDLQNKRISLSLKQLEENPWEKMDEKYPKGTRIKGVVKNITDFGIFVTIEEGVDGIVHISDISWKKVNHPSDLYQKGQDVEAVVMNVDKTNKRLSLGIKQLEKNPWMDIDKRCSPGMVLNGVIKGITAFGAFVGIEDGVEGLVHISELDRQRKKGIDIKSGDEVEIEILNIDVEDKRIGLSIRRVVKSQNPDA